MRFDSLRSGNPLRTTITVQDRATEVTLFRFPSPGKSLADNRHIFMVPFLVNMFRFPSPGKSLADATIVLPQSLLFAEFCFNSLRPGNPFQTVSPNFSPVGPWLRSPKTKRELRGFFRQKFSPKFRQTLVNIEPNAIFYEHSL